MTRDRVQRFVLLPLSSGCASLSSVTLEGRQEDEESSSLQKLIGSLKRFSKSFIQKKEMAEEGETQMEIGYPTDVKHVTHIGVYGSATTNPTKCWENLSPPEIFSFPSLSFRQFELAMAAQASEPLFVGRKIPTKSQTIN